MYTNNCNSRKRVICATREAEINVLEISEHEGITQPAANPGRLTKQIPRLSLEERAGSVHMELIKITPISGA